MDQELEKQAQEWVGRWRQEVQRRRKVEETLGSVSWRLNDSMDLSKQDPLLRERVLQLLE